MIKQTKRRMKRTNHHLTERQVKLLRIHSEQTGLSVAEILRQCVNEWLDRKGTHLVAQMLEALEAIYDSDIPMDSREVRGIAHTAIEAAKREQGAK